MLSLTVFTPLAAQQQPSAQDLQKANNPLPDDAVLVHQERAYTSPIWYTP